VRAIRLYGVREDATVPLLGDRFRDALDHAAELHATQTRKGPDRTPYVAHLLAACSLVIESGGDEDQAIAALLHDALEDQGHLTSYAELSQRYGDRVAELVRACSDTEVTPKPPWRSRKQAYRDHLENAPADVLLVSCADKLHNARSTLTDLREVGIDAWLRFSREVGVDEHLDNYAAQCVIFNRRLDGRAGRLAGELHRVVVEMHELSDAHHPDHPGTDGP
jgi:(p)ppGpp synthase/HD superfamily hydrolase